MSARGPDFYQVEGDHVVPLYGVILGSVHSEWKCHGRPCVIHRPTNHRMRKWPLAWRDEPGIFDRVCAHGISHPDPDQFDYWRSEGLMHHGMHSCDSCCAEHKITAAPPARPGSTRVVT